MFQEQASSTAEMCITKMKVLARVQDPGSYSSNTCLTEDILL